MSNPLRAVLFDLDGTLIDTAPDFAAVIAAMRERRSLAPLPYARIRETVSEGARGLVAMAFDMREHDPAFEPLRQELLADYAGHLAVESRLFAGMDAVLADIEARGLRWAVVTNKPVRYAEPLLAALQLGERCGALICPDHVRERKPHPESLALACRQLGCDTRDAIYLGDHRRDIEAGRNASMPTVACAYGYVHPNDPCSDWGADFIAASVAELTPILHRFL